MNERRVFCTNAETMGQSTSPPSTPRGPPPSAQFEQHQQQKQEEKYEQQSRVQDANQTVQQPKQLTKDEQQPSQSPKPPQSVENELPYLCSQFAATNLAVGGCETTVEQHKHNSRSTPITTEHYRNQLQKLRSICGHAAIMNFELNNIFLKRLEEIDCLDEQCGGDSNISSQLRLVTFQDWVDLLLHVNYIIFGNMSAMEVEAYEKIMNCFQSVRGEQQQAQNENRKLRKDMCAIIKLVQQAFHHNTWNTNDICLETLTVNQLLGIQVDQTRPESETEKVTKDMNSLANEMAAKHDEVCRLQAQICTLDEVVQTARQKLILKDQCIAQLNQQLAELQDCMANMTQDVNSKSRLVEQYEEVFDTMDCSSCLFDNINEKDQQANQLMRLLNKELTEFMDLLSAKDIQVMECRRKQLSCIFERINSDRSETLGELENLRAQLRSLDGNIDELEVPSCCDTQRSEDNYDNQLIDGLRRRLKTINEVNKQLNSRCQQAEAQQRFELMNIRCAFEAEKEINAKNSKALKEIADLLSKLRCSDLSYEEIYTEKSTENPFCIAIMEMYEKLNELENSKEEENLQLFANNNEPTTPAHNT